MPAGLKRIYGFRHLHFITCSCYQRIPLLGSARRRDTFLRVLEKVRMRFAFEVEGFVVMPEHIHLLIGEPAIGNPSKVMQVLKQETARKLLPKPKRGTSRQQRSLFPEPEQSRKPQFWQRRFYDFNVWSQHKRTEKLNYMHDNPVKRGLVTEPEQWKWSSYCTYRDRMDGLVTILGSRGKSLENKDKPTS